MTQVWNTPLTPLAFLRRSAEVFPAARWCYANADQLPAVAAETTRVAHALHARHGRGDRVA